MPFSDCIIAVVKTSYDLFEDTLLPLVIFTIPSFNL